MELNFSPEEQAFRVEVRTWVRDSLPQELADKVRTGLRPGEADIRLWAEILGKRGWLASSWPKRFGGPGWTGIQKHLFDRECIAAGAPRLPPFGPVMVAPVIMQFGTPAQHESFLPDIASGKAWWCQGYSEPGSGSDLASIKTRATRVGDTYIVSGQKTWTTFAQYADWIFCLVRTSNHGKPQAGISFLLINMKSPGITVRPIRLLDGDHEVNEVFFDDVEVPVANLIGDENSGWTYAKHLLGHERTTIADVNGARRELERLKRIAKANGIYDDVRFRDEIVRFEVDVIALEMMVLRVLAEEASGEASLDVAGLLKIRGSEVRQRYTELMMCAAGPSSLPLVPQGVDTGGSSVLFDQGFPGAALNAPLTPAYFNMRKTSIYGGSNEVQKNIVAQKLFGSSYA